jgi:hypothetical protein
MRYRKTVLGQSQKWIAKRAESHQSEVSQAVAGTVPLGEMGCRVFAVCDGERGNEAGCGALRAVGIAIYLHG